MTEDINYYKTEDFLDMYMRGKKNIHDMIEVKNIKHTTTYHISFLTHLLYLCKTNNLSLLDILNTLKTRIETFVVRLIKENYYIKSYIETVIKEWSLILEAENIFDKLNDDFNYEEFVSQNKLYNELIGGMKGLEANIQNKEYSIDSDIKDTLMLLHTNCIDCKEKLLNQIGRLVNIITDLEPTYNYLLIDLSLKGKANYLEKVELANNNSSVFSRLLNTSTETDIPKNINTIFLNYIFIINMLKKEYHYLITALKTIHKNLDGKYKSLDGLMNGLNIQNHKSLEDVSIDSSTDDDDDDDSSLF